MDERSKKIADTVKDIIGDILKGFETKINKAIEGKLFASNSELCEYVKTLNQVVEILEVLDDLENSQKEKND